MHFFAAATAAAKKCFVFVGYGNRLFSAFFCGRSRGRKKMIKKNRYGHGGGRAAAAAAETPKPWPGGGLKKTDDFEVNLGTVVSKNSLV